MHLNVIVWVSRTANWETRDGVDKSLSLIFDLGICLSCLCAWLQVGKPYGMESGSTLNFRFKAEASHDFLVPSHFFKPARFQFQPIKPDFSSNRLHFPAVWKFTLCLHPATTTGSPCHGRQNQLRQYCRCPQMTGQTHGDIRMFALFGSHL